jgi:hypothetical protein
MVAEEATAAPNSSPSGLKIASGGISCVSLRKNEISAFVTVTQGVLNTCRRWGMKVQAKDSGGKSTGRLVLGVLTIILLVFFTIPSIPTWWAVFHLPGLQTRIQETGKELTTAEGKLERLQAKKLMSASDPASTDKLGVQIAALTKEVSSLRDQLSRDDKIKKAAGEKTGGGFKEWLRILLEAGGLVGAIFHSADAIKRVRSWLSLLRGGA